MSLERQGVRYLRFIFRLALLMKNEKSVLKIFAPLNHEL